MAPPFLPPVVVPIAAETPIARMERITKGDLPVLPPPPDPAEPDRHVERWKVMAQGYGSLCIRQREFEDAILREFKRNDVRLTKIELLLNSIVVTTVIDPEEEPTGDRVSAHG